MNPGAILAPGKPFMTKIRTAVIGAGHLGRFHAEKYASMPACELRAVVDTHLPAAEAVAQKHGARACADYREILREVDAVSIAVPATAHYEIARDCLEAGLDLLVEKPLAITAADAARLVDLAARRDRILQVGHLERFNPVTVKLQEVLRDPMFIECHRIAPYNPRGTDVDVVRDLMIHDLDLVLGLTRARLEHVEAMGTPVLTSSTDIVNARVYLSSGCVANITCSRISLKSERKMRFFQPNTYISADFKNRQLAVFHREPGEGEMPKIAHQEYKLEGDALRDEIAAFLHSVGTRTPPQVSGEDGRLALDAAEAVHAALARGPRWTGARH